MKKFLFVFVAIFISSISFSQSSWQVVTVSLPGFWLEAIQMTSANTGYACGCYPNISSGGFMKTTNGGLNWQFTYKPSHNVDDISFLNDLTGYAIEYTTIPGYYHGGIYKTTDGAVSWVCQDSVENGNFFKIKFYDLNTGLVAGKYGSAYFTSNGGVNWLNVNSGSNGWMEPQTIWCLDANTWLVGDGQLLNKTTNRGVNWIINDSVPASSIYFFNNSTGITTGGNGCIYKTTNSGGNWIRINNSLNGWLLSLIFTDQNTGYCCRYGSPYIYKTTDGGYNWTEQLIYPNNILSALHFLNNNTGFAAGSSGRIFKTTNGGSVFVSNISGEVPDKFDLGQNYPNPFNQSSIINLQCSMKGMVTLKVFDISGREVQSLVNETLSPGTYQVRFDGSGLSSGIYYYKLTVDNKPIAIKKMVMIK
ncbi:MAG: T9SS type A sorting domain-containing protein [Ignavibacteria bacterium]|nr:T9SS type A sorting domain-containing protein [Ignavibacteria bacterium]